MKREISLGQIVPRFDLGKSSCNLFFKSLANEEFHHSPVGNGNRFIGIFRISTGAPFGNPCFESSEITNHNRVCIRQLAHHDLDDHVKHFG